MTVSLYFPDILILFKRQRKTPLLGHTGYFDFISRITSYSGKICLGHNYVAVRAYVRQISLRFSNKTDGDCTARTEMLETPSENFSNI